MEEGELKEVLSRSSPMYFGCVSFKNFALSWKERGDGVGEDYVL
jgi:hypothetical protein